MIAYIMIAGTPLICLRVSVYMIAFVNIIDFGITENNDNDQAATFQKCNLNKSETKPYSSNWSAIKRIQRI